VGLFTGLLTLPLAPVRGVVWVAEQVLEEAERQYYDEGNIRRELAEVQLDFEDGRIDDRQRAERERELLGRLAIGQEQESGDG
jgi:Gas vesicle protein G